MTSGFTKALVNGVAGLALVAAVAATPAQAHDGGAIAAGVVGGLALGAIAGSAAANSNGYNNGYYAPAYAAPRPYYNNGGCYLQRQPVYDEDGYVVGHRRVRVCE